jgi:prepilin-type N-terminal cleavage/methylation domain-containing protein
MLSHLQSTNPDRERGMTLIELLIVLLLMTVVLSIAGNALISLTNTANRTDSMVKSEQNAATALAAMARDIRSAHLISFAAWGTAPAPSLELELELNQPSGQWIKWVYSSSGSSECPGAGPSLTRYVGTTDTTLGSASSPVLCHVANGTTDPIFTYWSKTDQQLSTTTNGDGSVNTGNEVACTTRIHVQLDVSPGISGVNTIKVTDDVALTDQVAIVSAPGNGQC